MAWVLLTLYLRVMQQQTGNSAAWQGRYPSVIGQDHVFVFAGRKCCLVAYRHCVWIGVASTLPGFCHDLFDSDCDWQELGIIGAE
jgi:hypothetical protein